MKSKIDQLLILSAVRALLLHVPITLRSVSLELENEIIQWKCVFDISASENDIELLTQASAELISDFPNYGLKEIIKIVASPKKENSLKNLVYHRHEHNYFETT